jgi:hypothetical protein
MKKFLFILLLIVLPLSSFSQVFNTASTLKRGSFSIGIEPLLYDRDLGLFLNGGIGLKSGLDLNIKYGFLKYSDYFGADLEWSLLATGKPNISLVTGGHVMHDFGLDLGLNLSFPIGNGAQLYSGIDTDINFYPSPTGTQLLAWLPLGVQVGLQHNMNFLLEAEVPLNNNAYVIFGGGIAFDF